MCSPPVTVVIKDLRQAVERGLARRSSSGTDEAVDSRAHGLQGRWLTVMRSGIDGGCWLNRRGYGRYTRGLLSALARQDSDDDYFIFVDPETGQAPDLPTRFQKVVV